MLTSSPPALGGHRRAGNESTNTCWTLRFEGTPTTYRPTRSSRAVRVVGFGSQAHSQQRTRKLCPGALPSLDSPGSERVLQRNHDPNARAYFDRWARVAFLGFEDVLVLCTAESDRANGSLRRPLACSRENESCPTARRRPGRGPIPKTQLDRRLQRLAAAMHWSRPRSRAGIAQLHGSGGYRGQRGR